MAASSIRASKAYLEIVGKENVGPALNRVRAMVGAFGSRVKALGATAIGSVIPGLASRASEEAERRQTRRRRTPTAAASTAAVADDRKRLTELTGSIVALGKAGTITAGSMRRMAESAARTSDAALAFQKAFVDVVTPMRGLVTELRRLGATAAKAGTAITASLTRPPPAPPPPPPAAAPQLATGDARKLDPNDTARKMEAAARSTRDASAAFRGFAGSLGGVGSGLQRVGLLARSTSAQMRGLGLSAKFGGIALLGLVAGGLRSFVTVGSEAFDISQRLGISTEAWSELSFVAQRAGGSAASLEQVIRKMQDSVFSAAAGSQQAARALGALGLSAEDLLKLRPDQQLELISERLAQVGDPAARTSLALDIFGRSMGKIMPLLVGGAAGIRAARDAARDLGVTISGDYAEAADRLGDTFGALGAVAKKAFAAIGAAIAPTVQRVATLATTAVKGAVPWIRANGDVVLSVIAIGSALAVGGAALLLFAPLVTAVGSAIGGLGAALSLLGTLAGGVAAAVGTIGIPIAGLTGVIGAAAVGVAGFSIEWGRMFSTIAASAVAGFGALRTTVGSAVSGIRDALSSGDATLAGEIFWKAIEVASLQGKQAILSAWQGIMAEIPTSWDQMVIKMASALTVLEGKLLSLREQAINGLSNYFTEVAEDPLGAFASVLPGGNALLGLRAAFSTPDPNGLTEEQRAANRRNVLNAADDTSANRVAEIEAETRAKLDALNAEFERSKAPERAAAEAANAARDAEIAKAVAALEALRKSAEEKAAPPYEQLPPVPPDSAPGGLSLDSILNSLRGGELAASESLGASAVGSFSGAAAGRLGPSSVERMSKAAERTAENTDRLSEILRAVQGLDIGLGEG